MSDIISTSRGGKKLVDMNKHTYRKDKCVNGVWYWKCVVPKCGGRAKTEHGQDDGGREVISKITTTNPHTHAANPNKVSSLMAKQKLKILAENTQEQTRTVIATAVQGLSLPESAALPGSSSLSRCVRKWRSNKLMAPPNPTSVEGFEIPERYSKTLEGDKFLLHDSGVNDCKRILICGTESGKIAN